MWPFNSMSTIASAAPTLANLFQRELTQARSSGSDLQAINSNMRQLIIPVHDLLKARPWEICE
jgi:hypothetical protein